MVAQNMVFQLFPASSFFVCQAQSQRYKRIFPVTILVIYVYIYTYLYILFTTFHNMQLSGKIGEEKNGQSSQGHLSSRECQFRLAEWQCGSGPWRFILG